MGATSVHLIKEAKMGGYNAGVQRQLGGGEKREREREKENWRVFFRPTGHTPSEEQVRTGGVISAFGCARVSKMHVLLQWHTHEQVFFALD